jgi:hypothetical protein
MDKWPAALLALLSGVAVAALIQAVIYPISGHRTLVEIAVTFAVSLPVTLIIAVPLGLLGFYLADRIFQVTLVSAVLGGLVMGGVAAILFRLPSSPVMTEIARFAGLGAAAGVVFYMVWMKLRRASS